MRTTKKSEADRSMSARGASAVPVKGSRRCAADAGEAAHRHAVNTATAAIESLTDVGRSGTREFLLAPQRAPGARRRVVPLATSRMMTVLSVCCGSARLPAEAHVRSSRGLSTSVAMGARECAQASGTRVCRLRAHAHESTQGARRAPRQQVTDRRLNQLDAGDLGNWQLLCHDIRT